MDKLALPIKPIKKNTGQPYPNPILPLKNYKGYSPDLLAQALSEDNQQQTAPWDLWDVFNQQRPPLSKWMSQYGGYYYDPRTRQYYHD